MMVALLFAFFGLLPQVRGAAYTFTNTNTGTYDYTSGTGWSPGAPVGGFTNSLIFGNGASLAAGANVTVSNNLGFVRFNSITVNYAGPGSGTAPTFTLVGQGVTLSSSNGSNPYILISNTGTVRPNTTISQWITFDANTTITTVSDLTMTGRFYTNANNAAVTKNGAGVLRITGDNTANGYTGNWTVASGELHIGNASSGNLGSGTITLTNNAIYVQRTTGNQAVNNVISGTTSQFVTFHLGSNNVVTLNKQSDYTSGFTYLQPLLGAGTGELRLGTNNALSGNTVVEMQNAAGYTQTLNLNNYNQTLKHLQSTAGATAANTKVSLGSGTLTVGDASSRTFAGEISGSGGVVKTGSGSWILTASNTYSGGTVISNGTLRLDNANAAGSGAITQLTNTFLEINTSGTVANAMSIFNVRTLQTVTLSGNKTLNNATYNVTNGTTTTESGALSGSGGLTKAGNGTLLLAGSTNNTFAGATLVEGGSLVLSNSSGNAINNSLSITVKSGASLILGASNQIGDGVGLVLDGGTFIVGTGVAGYSETLGTLTLSASSTIDLGSYSTGLRQLVFANSSSIQWATNAVLTITNWQGVATQSSAVAEIIFGTGGLTSTQLGQIYFANQDITGGVLLGGTGELAPIPEAPVVWGAAAVAAVIAWRERRRLRSLFSARRLLCGAAGYVKWRRRCHKARGQAELQNSHHSFG